MKKATKIFTVITFLCLTLSCTSVFATGPYLGTSYNVINYGNGTEVIEISGEKSDVMVELMRLKYDYIKQGKLQSTYFYVEGDNADAKLFITTKPEEGLLKIYESCGTQDEALKKVEFLKANGYTVVIIDDSDLCRTTVVAEKSL